MTTAKFRQWAALAMLLVAVLATTPPVQALPSQASEIGAEHAGTHGPHEIGRAHL